MEINFRLKDAFNELNAVTITAGTFEASDSKRMVMLRPMDIVTTANHVFKPSNRSKTLKLDYNNPQIYATLLLFIAFPCNTLLRSENALAGKGKPSQNDENVCGRNPDFSLERG